MNYAGRVAGRGQHYRESEKKRYMKNTYASVKALRRRMKRKEVITRQRNMPRDDGRVKLGKKHMVDPYDTNPPIRNFEN